MRRNWLAILKSAVLAVVLLTGSLVLLATLTPLTSSWSSVLAAPWHDPGSCPTLIVLAGSDLNDGLLGYSSYWRAVYAVRAQREHGFERIILSGGSGGEEPVSQSMADFLIGSGVSPEIIQLESKSRSTRENALYTEPLARSLPGCKSLMTSDFHMFRARRTFEKIGVDVLPTPLPDGLKRSSRWHKRWLVAVELTTESAKIAYYWWKGWI